MLSYKYSVLVALSCMSCHVSPISSNDTSGTYIGLETIGSKYNDITPNDTTDRWYHENTLTIRNDSIFLEQVPVVFYHKRPKAYSSSDGGFYFYRGRISKDSTSRTAYLLLTQHDYVIFPYHLKNPADSSLQISEEEKFKRELYIVDSTNFKKIYPLEIHKKAIIMNGVEYRRKSL